MSEIPTSAGRLLARRRAVWLAVCVAATSLLAFGLLRSSSSVPSRPGGVIAVASRHAAPSLAGGHPLQGHPAVLAGYRGRVVFLNFWASWCHPCRKEAPQLERFAASLDPDRAVVVGIDVNDTRPAALGFLRRFRVGYPILADPSAAIAVRYRILGIPATVVVDAQGRIAARLLGPQTVVSLRRALRGVTGR